MTIDDLAQLQQSLLWTADDAQTLRQAAAILVPQTEQILDVWCGFVGSNPHLVATFSGADSEPSGDYLAAVRERFGMWIDFLRADDASEAEVDAMHNAWFKAVVLSVALWARPYRADLW